MDAVQEAPEVTIAKLQAQIAVQQAAIDAFKEASKSKSQNNVECPKCGKTVFFLPDHLRRVHR